MTDKSSRGWNDPPPLPAVATGQSSSRGRRTGINLNKRVAFPLSGPPTVNEDIGDTSQQLPKLPATLPPKTGIHVQNSSNDLQQREQLPLDFERTSSFEEMEQHIDKVFQNATDLEHRSDVEKKLKDMKNFWKEGLDEQICYKLLLIFRALVAKDIKLASELQLELVSQWPTETSKWAVAVRCLVNHLRVVCEPIQSGVISESSSQPSEFEPFETQ